MKKPPPNRFGVYYTVHRGSTGVFRLTRKGAPFECATKAFAEAYARRTLIGTEFANVLNVARVFVGTAENPTMFEVKSAARRRTSKKSGASRKENRDGR